MEIRVRRINVDLDDERIETGPLKINDDWTGLFIRGDDCFDLKLLLESFLTDPKFESFQDNLDFLQNGRLKTLIQMLSSTNEF